MAKLKLLSLPSELTFGAYTISNFLQNVPIPSGLWENVNEHVSRCEALLSCCYCIVIIIIPTLNFTHGSSPSTIDSLNNGDLFLMVGNLLLRQIIPGALRVGFYFPSFGFSLCTHFVFLKL